MDAIEIGALSVYPYGICAAAGAAAMLLWAYFRTNDRKNRRALEYFALLALPLGMFFAHLAYCLCDLDWISDYFWETLADFPGGGYLLFGALAGMTAALFAATRLTGTSFSTLADLLAAPFLLFTALLTAGDGLAGAGYGWKVEDWFQADNGMSLFTLEDTSFFSGFPFAVTDSVYGYANWAVFLPIAIFLAISAFVLARRGTGVKESPGGAAVRAVSLYAAVRVLYESLRQDDTLKWGFVRVNQILGAVLILMLLILCFFRMKRSTENRDAGKQLAGSLGIFIAGVLLAGAMEFALEKKIGFLEWMPMDVCYVFSAAGCALLFFSCSRLRKRAFGSGIRKDGD